MNKTRKKIKNESLLEKLEKNSALKFKSYKRQLLKV